MKKIISMILTVALLASLASVCVLAADVDVASGKSYELIGVFPNLSGATYPDEEGKTITDDKYAESNSFSDAAWVGFNVGADDIKDTETPSGAIIVDLGKTEKITKVYIEANETTSAGISAPEGVEILVSADKAAWTSAGNATVALKSEGIYDITLTLDSVEARYVKVVFDHKSNWVFISEVDIYASGAASEGGSTTPPASDKVVNNLISKDLTWTATDVDFGGSVGKCTYSYDGDKLTVASDVNWPNITASFDEGIVVGADDEIAVDFTLTSGYVNFYVIVDVNGEDYALYIQHSIAPDSISASSGDLSVQGEYKTSFKVKDGVGSKSGVGAVPANCATIPAADSYTIKAITIMPCGGNASLTFNAFTVTSDAPAADEPTNPSTGDAAMVFALIALVAMAGAVVVAKKVR